MKEHIHPINATLRELRKHIVKPKYWKFEGNNNIYGPMDKTKLMKMIQEVPNPNN